MTDTQQGTGDQGSERKPFKDASPDEVREQMREKTAGGVRRATEAMGQASSRMDETRERTTSAMQKTGETTRDVGGAAAKEARRTKDELQK